MEGEQNYKIIKGKNYFCVKTHNYAGVKWIKGTKYYASDNYTLVNKGCEYYCPEYSKEDHNNLFEEVKYDGCVENKMSANKVESKFKVGNWYQCTKDFFGKGVTFDNNTAYYCAKEGCLQDEYGCHIAIVKDLYDNFKLWTIQDAKDGDVLHSPSHHLIWIYKDNEHYHACVNMNYVSENVTTDGLISIPNDVCPTTKDEQTILFVRMNEAGYEWDEGKKELRKIEKQGEQKETLCDKCKKAQPSHSCQDIIALGRCYVEGINTSNKIEPKRGDENSKVNDETNAQTGYGKYVDECLNEASKHFFSEGEDKYSVADLFYAGVRCGKSWLEKQGKLKWTKEDEDNLNMAIYFMRSENTPYSPTDVEPVVEWLCGLKQKMEE